MIQISYEVIAPNRRSHTAEIASAIKTLAANPTSPDGVKGSFVVRAKHRAACFAAASDVGVSIKTRAEKSTEAGTFIRVTLK